MCPSCKGRLDVRADAVEGEEILEGALTCFHCRHDYAVTRGVPRFVNAGAYAATFGRQWNWFRTVQLDSANGSTESADTLRSTTGWGRRDIEGRTVLDAGAGAGRFAECVAGMGGRVFGVDLTEAIDAAYRNIGARDGVYLAQADIFALPFRPGTFDRAYSIGVLHHTPDTERAFSCVASTVKVGGHFAVYLYDRYGAWYRGSDALRHVTTRLPASAVLALSTLAIPLYYLYLIPGLGRVCRNVVPISPAASWRWRWLDTFDWLLAEVPVEVPLSRSLSMVPR